MFGIWISLCSEFLFSINGNVFRKLTLSPDKRGGTYTFPEGFIWLSIPVIIVSSLCHNAQAGTIWGASSSGNLDPKFVAIFEKFATKMLGEKKTVLSISVTEMQCFHIFGVLHLHTTEGR